MGISRKSRENLELKSIDLSSIYDLRRYSQDIVRPYLNICPNIARHFECGLETWGRLNAVKYDESGKTGIEGYVKCNKYLLCAVCGKCKKLEENSKISKKIDNWIDDNKVVIQVDLSFAHHHHKFENILPKLKKAFSSKTIHDNKRDDNAFLYFRETYGLASYTKVLEVVYSTDRGWNPHFHTLMFLDMPPEDLTEAAVEDIQALIFDWWRGALKQVGLPGASPVYGVHVQRVTTSKVADYILKLGSHSRKDRKRDEDDKSLTIDELIELAGRGNKKAEELLVEYVCVVYSRGKAHSRVKHWIDPDRKAGSSQEATPKPKKTTLKDFTPEEHRIIKLHKLEPQIKRLKSREEIEALLRPFLGDEQEAASSYTPFDELDETPVQESPDSIRSCLPISSYSCATPLPRSSLPYQRRRQHFPKPAIVRAHGRSPPRLDG